MLLSLLFVKVFEEKPESVWNAMDRWNGDQMLLSSGYSFNIYCSFPRYHGDSMLYTVMNKTKSLPIFKLTFQWKGQAISK